MKQELNNRKGNDLTLLQNHNNKLIQDAMLIHKGGEGRYGVVAETEDGVEHKSFDICFYKAGW